jgi:transcription elongation factor Elf1
MTDSHPTEFVCPECGSGYKVVRVKADADLPYRLIYCRVCKHPLTAMEGEFVLKYFLVRRASDSPRKKAPQGSGA